MDRRQFLNVAGTGSVMLALPGCMSISKHVSSKRPPNIVLIVSDDQGYCDSGCYGSTEVKTPNLDRLAGEGVRLTNFYVTWPACTPSRGSLLTGRYPQRNGTYDMFRNDLVDYDHLYTNDEYAVSWEMIGGMDTREVLIPRVLKKAGYASGIFGKWYLCQLHRFLSLQRGFDEFYGFTNTGIDYWTHERYGVPSMRRGNKPTTEDKGTYATDLFRREAIRFIRKNRTNPFFCYLPFNAPHGASNLERPRPGVQAPIDYIRKHYGSYDPKEANSRKARRMRYMAAISCMDEAVGQIMQLLDEYKMTDNTLVIFLSDNGGSRGTADNGPLRGGKSHLFEGGIRVPCIVRWPGVIPRGTTCDEFLTTMEIIPMLCRAAGIRPPRGVVLDGFDMTSVLAPNKNLLVKRCSCSAATIGPSVSKTGNGSNHPGTPVCSTLQRISVNSMTYRRKSRMCCEWSNLVLPNGKNLWTRPNHEGHFGIFNRLWFDSLPPSFERTMW